MTLLTPTSLLCRYAGHHRVAVWINVCSGSIFRAAFRQAVSPGLTQSGSRFEVGEPTHRSERFPFGHGNVRAFARCRTNVKFVAQPLCAAQTQAQPLPAGKTVGQRLRDIRNARAVVDEVEPQSDAAVTLQSVEMYIAATAIYERIARKFTRRGDHFGLINLREAERLRFFAEETTQTHDLLARSDRQNLIGRLP